MIFVVSKYVFMYVCMDHISRNFQNNFILGRTSHFENIIIERHVSLTDFQKAEKVPNICLLEIILSEIFLMQKFHKVQSVCMYVCMNICTCV